MSAQNFPRPLNQQLDKISDPIPTNDVLADALLVTETTYFKGSGSSYTGTVPSNNFKYGVFCVVKRNDASFIVHATSADGTSSNYYDGSAWGGWTPSTRALQTTVNGKQNALSVENFSSSVTAAQSGTSANDVFLKKYGKVVTFSATLTNTSTSSAKTIGGYTPYMKFPTGLRPSVHLNVLGRLSDGSVKYLYIPYYAADGYGVIQCPDSLTLPANGSIRFSIAWVLD